MVTKFKVGDILKATDESGGCAGEYVRVTLIEEHPNGNKVFGFGWIKDYEKVKNGDESDYGFLYEHQLELAEQEKPKKLNTIKGYC